MKYQIDKIKEITEGQFLIENGLSTVITNVVYDTRKISYAKASIFVALKGENNDGHNYIADAIKKGITNFIVDQDLEIGSSYEVNIIKVKSSLVALQTIARHHRNQFSYPVIGITGSNGKTMIKEWLSQALNSKYNIVKSPQSYNSQLGVCISLLEMEDSHEVAIIEAGISTVNEMEKLEKMIQPTVGILSNIGDAHSSGFKNNKEKLEEKLKLFKGCKALIYSNIEEAIDTTIRKTDIKKILCWGLDNSSAIVVKEIKKGQNQTSINLSHKGQLLNLVIPFNQDDLIENCMHIISYLILDGWNEKEIQERIIEFQDIPNRLELKEGKYESLLINDSYSADIASFQLALEYQEQHAGEREKILILTPLEDQSDQGQSYHKLYDLISQKNITQIIGIGIKSKFSQHFENLDFIFYADSNACILNHNFSKYANACILIKGASKFNLEIISDHLSKQVHQTILETNYNAVAHNLNVYKSFLKNETKVMAIIKAEAYGSGSIEMAHFFARKNIDYLGVALIDEAIKIRHSGIETPIMIFNIQENNLDLLWEYNLEPEIYSIQLFDAIIHRANVINKPLCIHIKIDTGMHRLGFEKSQIETIISKVSNNKNIIIQSIFSHLASSENHDHDTYSENQFKLFEELSNKLSEGLGYKPMRHMLNTGGVIRFPKYQYDMVRIGIGLYGIDETKSIHNKLEKAHTLKAKILQIKKLKAGDATGYNRSGIVDRDKTIAVISIGYADGFMRMSGNGHFAVLVNGIKCPTIGNVCMDVSMIDISHMNDVKEGDNAIIFSKELPIQELAESCQTISYEIISRIAPRVKRTYIYN